MQHHKHEGWVRGPTTARFRKKLAMQLERKAKDTLTVAELDPGDELVFITDDGTRHVIRLEQTCACRLTEIYDKSGIPPVAATGAYRFWCQLNIDGASLQLNRYVGTQDCFYEPWEFNGVRFWFDAVDEIFQIMEETHGPCRPKKRARFVFQDAGRRICPPPLHPWCPLPPGGLRLTDCYRGEDCWMGPYDGNSAHGGLDINHPAGTPLRTPIAFDGHGLFNTITRGDSNNRWQGIRRWEDGSTWILRVAHLIRLRVPETGPLAAGVHYADGAGVSVCYREHSHFAFEVREYGETYFIDPWILFWQMYRDGAAVVTSGYP